MIKTRKSGKRNCRSKISKNFDFGFRNLHYKLRNCVSGFENINFGFHNPQFALQVAELWKWLFELKAVYCFHNPQSALRVAEMRNKEFDFYWTNVFWRPQSALRVAEKVNSKLKNFRHPQSTLWIAETTCFKEKLCVPQFTKHIKTRTFSKFYKIQRMKRHRDKDNNHETQQTR